jgi:nitric oxide reductase subunit B
VIGLAGVIILSLVPAGFYQFAIAIRHGIWYARSPEVTGSTFIHTVTWLRLVPDLVFDVGAFALVAFLVRAIAVDLKLRRAGPGPEESANEVGRRAA